MTPFSVINFLSIFEQLLTAKWIANLGLSIILWKKVSFSSKMFNNSRVLLLNKKLSNLQNNKWFLLAFMTYSTSYFGLTNNTLQKICIWICQNNKFWRKKKAVSRTATNDVFKNVLWTAQLPKQESWAAYKCCIYFLLKNF